MKSFYILFIYLEEEVQAFMLQIQFYLDKLDAKKTSMVKEADEIEIAKFIAEVDNHNKPIRVDDVVKKFGIHALKKGNKINLMVTFAVIATGAGVVAIIMCWCVKRKYNK